MPIEETSNSLTSRKCSSAAWPRHFSANRRVPSSVARSVIVVAGLPCYPSPAQVELFLTAPMAQVVSHKRASFCDTANPFHERIFHLHGDCYRTSEPRAKDSRPGRPSAVLRPDPRVVSGAPAPRNAVRLRIGRRRRRRARRHARRTRGILRWSGRRWLEGGLRRSSLGFAEEAQVVRATLHRFFRAFCE